MGTYRMNCLPLQFKSDGVYKMSMMIKKKKKNSPYESSDLKPQLITLPTLPNPKTRRQLTVEYPKVIN